MLSLLGDYFARMVVGVTNKLISQTESHDCVSDYLRVSCSVAAVFACYNLTCVRYVMLVIRALIVSGNIGVCTAPGQSHSPLIGIQGLYINVPFFLE